MDMDYSANAAMAMLLTLFAGLSTALGGLIVVVFGSPSPAFLGHTLSFSSGVMLMISFVDLLPEAVGSVGFAQANIAFFVGMALFALLVRLVPEPDTLLVAGAGAGSGKKRNAKNNRKSEMSLRDKQSLMYMGIVTALGISVSLVQNKKKKKVVFPNFFLFSRHRTFQRESLCILFLFKALELHSRL